MSVVVREKCKQETTELPTDKHHQQIRCRYQIHHHRDLEGNESQKPTLEWSYLNSYLSRE